MTLMDAPRYTARHYKHLGREDCRQHHSGRYSCCVAVSLLELPSEHRVNRFLDAVQQRDYTKAFGIWNNDSDWQQHARGTRSNTMATSSFCRTGRPGAQKAR